ncbi:MAG: stalk domain-containing protein [Candidatus Ornithomonoglobus sp.]
MKKKVLSFVLALTMVLSCASVAVSAEESGKCGNNLTWTYSDNGTLTISGAGDMNNTVYDEAAYISYEWIDNFYDVKSLVLSEGITSIGAYAFEGLENLTGNVTVPNGVTRIGMGAFRWSGVTSVTLPSSLTQIDMGAFFECNLSDIYFEGTAEQWKNINIVSDYNENLINGNIHFSQSSPSENEEERVVTTDQGFSVTFGNTPVTQPNTAENDKITVNLNGSAISFDVPPQIINDRTMVPLRAIFEALGAEVEWNGELQTISATRGKYQIGMMIGGYNIVKITNGTDVQTITLDTAPVIVDERTLVPVRAVAESFDCEVEWDGSTKTVEIKAVGDNGDQTVSTASDNDRIYFNSTYRGRITNVSGTYDGNTLYFNFIKRPEIYIYDGSTVHSFNAGDLPQEIIARNGQVYYYGEGNGVVYRLDATTGNRQALFNKDGKVEIDNLTLYRDFLLVSGDQKVYAVNVNSGVSNLLYDPEELCNLNSITAAGGKVFILSRLHDNSGWTTSIIEADPATGSNRTLYEDVGDGLFCAANGSGIYFCEEESDETTYYFHSVSTGERQTVSKSDYNNAYTAYKQANDSSWHDEWEFTYYDSGVFRVSHDMTMKEKLYSGSGCTYIANNSENVAFVQRENGYIAVYVMDINGNNRREIINNGNNSIATNTDVNTSQTCTNCGGTGMVTCHLCGGTGKGQPIYMLGQKVEQGCVTCGSTGKVVCGSCGGSGQK